MGPKPSVQPPMRHVPSTDLGESAQGAGLRYVSDTQPGIRRQRSGGGFRSLGVEGTPIRDPEVLRRIKTLMIPPAWINAWISPRPDGHIQATGPVEQARQRFGRVDILVKNVGSI